MDYEFNPILANELATTPEKLNPEQLEKLYRRHQKGTFRWYCTKKIPGHRPGSGPYKMAG
jgi:hypothetical protein